MMPAPRRHLGLRAAACAVLCAAACAGIPSAVAAEPVYRCGNTYQQMPCADGRQLDVADTRDAAQRRQAEEAAAADRRSAAALAAENRARDKAVRPQRQAAGMAPRPEGAASADAGAAPHHTRTGKRKPTTAHAADKVLYSAASDPKAKKKEVPAEARMPAP